MNLAVTTSQAVLDTSMFPDKEDRSQTLILQNIGAGIVYVDFITGVTTARGIKLAVDAVLSIPEWTTAMTVYVIGSASADLRYTLAG